MDFRVKRSYVELLEVRKFENARMIYVEVGADGEMLFVHFLFVTRDFRYFS